MSIPERAFSAFGSRRGSDGGAPFWVHGSLLSGSRRARHRRRSKASVLSRSTRLSGASSGGSPVSIATKGHVDGDDTETPRTPARPYADAPRRAAEAGGRGAAASAGTTRAAGTGPIARCTDPAIDAPP